MIKMYKKYFYPNPFRYRKLKNIIDQDDIFEEIYQNIKPFLNNKFSLIQCYIDEFGDVKSEIKLIRILREKIRKNCNLLRSKSIVFSKSIPEQFDQINNIDNYQRNLRYLDLPIQPFTDKKGFEIQFLSSELIEDTIEEIEDGFSYIYDYCSDLLPESIELWTEYALIEPRKFPNISHDMILESTYEIFDKVFEDLQQNSINLFNWVISGDLDKRVLKIFKPKIQSTKIHYMLPILESILSLTIFLWIVNYITSKLVFKFRDKKLTVDNLQNSVGRIQSDLKFTKFRIRNKFEKLKIKFINLKTNYQYKVLKTILSKR